MSGLLIFTFIVVFTWLILLSVVAGYAMYLYFTHKIVGPTGPTGPTGGTTGPMGPAANSMAFNSMFPIGPTDSMVNNRPTTFNNRSVASIFNSNVACGNNGACGNNNVGNNPYQSITSKETKIQIVSKPIKWRMNDNNDVIIEPNETGTFMLPVGKYALSMNITYPSHNNCGGNNSGGTYRSMAIWIRNKNSGATISSNDLVGTTTCMSITAVPTTLMKTVMFDITSAEKNAVSLLTWSDSQTPLEYTGEFYLQNI